MITIFTPTYNRGYILPKLYESLKRQTYKDFEWIVVDDGSTDNTQSLLKEWQEECIITLRFFFQSNGGKHRAINKGVREAKGELFFTVDSDDYLPVDSLEIIMCEYEHVRGIEVFSGVCGSRYYPNGKRIGGRATFDVIECDQLYLRYKLKVKGDMADVVRTDVMRKYPFPDIEGEFFCTEAYVFNKIAEKYKMRYFDKNIYVCDYLPDGLTAKMLRIRMENPIATTRYYAELSRMDVPVAQKIKAFINYWRFAFCKYGKLKVKVQEIGVVSLPFLPIGWLFHIKDKHG